MSEEHDDRYPAKGSRNIYTCKECHHHIVTQDVDQGVTPFSIGCKKFGCGHLMVSSMYRVFDQTMAASWEWYRPPAVEVLHDAVRDHVAQGGLLLREATRYMPPPQPKAEKESGMTGAITEAGRRAAAANLIVARQAGKDIDTMIQRLRHEIAGKEHEIELLLRLKGYAAWAADEERQRAAGEDAATMEGVVT